MEQAPRQSNSYGDETHVRRHGEFRRDDRRGHNHDHNYEKDWQRKRDLEEDEKRSKTSQGGESVVITGRGRERESERERKRKGERERERQRERQREKESREHHREKEKRRTGADKYHERRRSRSRSRSRNRSQSPHRRRHHRDRRSPSSSSSLGADSGDGQQSWHRSTDKEKGKEQEGSWRREKGSRREERSRSRDRSETREERRERKRLKREKRDRKKAKQGKRGAVTEWGKHGIISESDITSRLTAEFRQWLVEERHINPETISRPAEKKEMATFVEDFNTATFPSDKYYNLEAHERKMAMIRAGETLQDDVGYDPLADEAAARASFKSQQRAKEAMKNSTGAETWQNKAQLEELRRVQMERVETAKMKQLGLDVKSNAGVRMDGTMFDK